MNVSLISHSTISVDVPSSKFRLCICLIRSNTMITWNRKLTINCGYQVKALLTPPADEWTRTDSLSISQWHTIWLQLGNCLRGFLTMASISALGKRIWNHRWLNVRNTSCRCNCPKVISIIPTVLCTVAIDGPHEFLF